MCLSLSLSVSVTLPVSVCLSLPPPFSLSTYIIMVGIVQNLWSAHITFLKPTSDHPSQKRGVNMLLCPQSIYMTSKNIDLFSKKMFIGLDPSPYSAPDPHLPPSFGTHYGLFEMSIIMDGCLRQKESM